jgi:hypothetical protein
MFASSTGWRAFVAFFPSESACVATFMGSSQHMKSGEKRREGKITGVKSKFHKPVRDLLCICIFPFGVVFAFEAGFDFG